MVVQHNMQAANASRMLNITTGQQSKTTEKLSSGYRINRAADDAAGLSISEKMRRQIRGLSQASTNASDGVSAVQTAEGALNEVHSMLQRMNELAVQAANGSNSQSDRQDLQNEITQLTAEIDRISQTTRFNEGYLLKGMETKSKHYISAHDAGLPGYLKEIENSDPALTTFSLTDKPLKNGDSITIAGVNYEIGEQLKDTSYKGLKETQNTVMGAGDTITTVDGTVYTLTNNVSESEILSGYYNAGDKVTDGNGEVYVYMVPASAGANADGNMANGQMITDENGTPTATTATAGWYRQSEVDNGVYIKLSETERVQILSAGNIYTKAKDVLAADGTTTLVNQSADAGTNHTIVKKLEKGEVSSFNLPDYSANTVLAKDQNGISITHDPQGVVTTLTIAKKLAVGDSITVNGATKTAADNKYAQTNLDDVMKAIEALPADSTVTISKPTGALDGSDPTAEKTYTIIPDSEKSDENTKLGKLTRSQIIDLLEEGSRVSVISAANTVGTVGDANVVAATPLGATGSYTGTETGTLMYLDAAPNGQTNFNTGWYTQDQLAQLAAIPNGSTAAGITPISATGISGVTFTNLANGDTYTYPTRNFTVAGVDTVSLDAISVKTAYEKIAEELEKASSIGTDEGARVVNNHDGTFTITQGSVTYADPLIFDLHVGSEADMTNKIVVQLNSMNATSLGLNGVNIVDDTGMNATYVIDVISDALAKVSAQRAELGAVQNRLEHSIANLDNVVENTEASESRIRDTDMADAMVQYSKNNILAQAGQSMLAQANQATQGVLSLLQ